MVSPVLTEGRHSGGFLVSTANGYRSMGSFNITNGGSLPVLFQAGTVMSIAALGTPTQAFTGTGNGTLTAVTLNAGAVPGAYIVQATSAASFNVYDPNGDELQPATVGTAYSDNEIAFLLTAGGTAFAAGDKFTITVPAGSGLIAPYTGASPANGILYNEAWVNNGDTRTVAMVVREAEVNLSELIWATGVTTQQQNTALAQLAAQQIIAR